MKEERTGEWPFWADALLFAFWPTIFVLERLPLGVRSLGEQAVIVGVGACGVVALASLVSHRLGYARWLRRVGVVAALVTLGLIVVASLRWPRA